MKILCKHENYDVQSWNYSSKGEIIAKVFCRECGTLVKKHIRGDVCKLFPYLYPEQKAGESNG